MGALESLLASQAAPQDEQKPTQGGALEKLLAGSNSSPAVPTAPAAKSQSTASKIANDQLSGTADAIDLVFDLVSAPVVAATEVGTRAYHGVRNLAGASNLSRRDISVDAQKNAGKVGDALGSPARKALQSLGFLPEGEGLVGQAMKRVMQSVEQAGKNLEVNTNGAVLKEDLQMGVNMLFGALGVKGMKHVATTAAEKGAAKNALKELARIQEEGNARNATTDAAAIAAEEARRAAGGVPAVALPQDNPIRQGEAVSAFDARVNAERQAYELMQTGASKAKVEGIIKKNPAVGVALDDIRKKRESFSAFLQEDPNLPEALGGTADLQRLSEIEGARARGEWVSPADLEKLFNARVAMQPRGEIKIEPAGSGQVTMTAERIRAALLGRRSEMGPAELEARDFAAGIQRGPLGEPIFSANPQPRAPGRANRDPKRATTSDSGLMGAAAVEEPDVFGAAATGGLSVADPKRRPTSGSGLMGTAARETPDLLGAAATGGRSVPDPRRPAGDSGLSGQPVKRDSLGTPLSPNQVLGLVGATGLGLAALYGDDKDRGDLAAAAAGGAIVLGHGKGISLEAIRALPDTATLREIRDASSYTLNTLENLPGNRSVLAKQAIGELLRRQEVTKAERDIIQGVLDSVPGEQITAKQLMAGVKEATGDFELKAKASGEYADYGLTNIGRTDSFGDAPDIDTAIEPQNATTTIYQSPFELGTNNHFGDPNYFAHTRSFYENGVKHVVEMQSDLAQKAGKVLTPEERATLQRQFTKVEALHAYLDEIMTKDAPFGGGPRLKARELADAADIPYFPEMQLKTLYDRASVRLDEIQAKLTGGESLEHVSPMLKRWGRRLVREELAASARGETPQRLAALQTIANNERGMSNGQPFPFKEEAIASAQKELADLGEPVPEPVVRFATADTVAKVEGWPEARRREVDQNVIDLRDELARVKELGYKPGEPWFDQVQTALTKAEEAQAKAPPAPRFFPEHQGIYDRYAKEVTSFLKQLGGKEVTDSAGHTWIEVPTEGTRKMPGGKRVQQFGAADPELIRALAAIGGGAAVASLLSDPDNKVRNMALAAVGTSLAVFGRSHVHGLGDMASAAVAGAERYLGMVSTRVGNMSPILLRRMREHERGVLTRTNTYLQAIGPFVEGLRKVPEAIRKELDAAILTGDAGKITAALGRAGKPELVAQFRKARQLLNEVGNELMQAGKLKGLLSDYYPRIVTDVPGLLKALGQEERTHIEKQLQEASRRTQREALRDLTPFETSQIINKALKSAPRGNGKPGFLQRRAVGEVTADLAKYYAPASESLPLYLRAVSKEIERARFFGENLLRDPVTGAVNLDESIGNLVRQEQQAGRINADQAMELGDILRSRFGPGERTTARPLQSVKNMVYAGLLGHVTSAITQVGDVAIAAAAHGILPTIKALQQSITRNPARVTVHDLGMIDHMAEELVSASRKPVTVLGRQVSTAKFLEKVFKYSGFSWVDSIGKNTSIQASKNKLEGWAKTPAGLKRLEATYGKAYSPTELHQLAADLRSGELTDLVKGVLFSELSDVQPITKLEVPQAYLDNPNGRTLYMLTTFMLKQSDIVRRKVVQEYRAGNRAKATEQALRYGLALGIGGATTQWINNWLLGRDQGPELTDIPLNALKTFGMSQYLLDKVRNGKPMQAIADVVAPPYKMFDDIISRDPSAIQYLPIVGRIYYARDWLDLLPESGTEKANRKYERDQRRKEREQ